MLKSLVKEVKIRMRMNRNRRQFLLKSVSLN